LLLKVAAFVAPKVKAIELNLINDKNDLSTLSDEELEAKLYKCDRVLYPGTYKQRRIERLNLMPIEFVKTKEQ
jgi:hypothetical protein